MFAFVTIANGYDIMISDSLIAAIHGDIEEANQRLDRPEHSVMKGHKFFTQKI